MLSIIEQFYLDQPEPARSCFLALREIILASDPDITEAWKYKLPFFCYKGKMFCYLWQDKKNGEPYIGIVEGKRIEHPLLEQGDRKRMKILPINPTQDLPFEDIKMVLQQSLDLYRNGVVRVK